MSCFRCKSFIRCFAIKTSDFLSLLLPKGGGICKWTQPAGSHCLLAAHVEIRLVLLQYRSRYPYSRRRVDAQCHTDSRLNFLKQLESSLQLAARLWQVFHPLLLGRTPAIFLQQQRLIQLFGKCEHLLFFSSFFTKHKRVDVGSCVIIFVQVQLFYRQYAHFTIVIGALRSNCWLSVFVQPCI